MASETLLHAAIAGEPVLGSGSWPAVNSEKKLCYFDILFAAMHPWDFRAGASTWQKVIMANKTLLLAAIAVELISTSFLQPCIHGTSGLAVRPGLKGSWQIRNEDFGYRQATAKLFP